MLTLSVMSLNWCSSLFSANQSCIWMLVSSTLDLCGFFIGYLGTKGYLQLVQIHPGNHEVITGHKEMMKALHYNFKMVVCILRNQPQTAWFVARTVGKTASSDQRNPQRKIRIWEDKRPWMRQSCSKIIREQLLSMT